MPGDSLDRIVTGLRERGFVVDDGLIAPALAGALRDDCLAAEAAGALTPAAVGRAHGTRQDSRLRGDATLWFDDEPSEPPRAALLATLDALRLDLNRRLLLGLESLEMHYALYPPGAGYVRHLDRFRDDDARTLSVVVYLNPQWRPGNGGELELYLGTGVERIAPAMGRSALFLSGEIEHAVLPTAVPRYSVAGWFRRREFDALP